MVGLHSILCVLPLMVLANSNVKTATLSTIPVFDPCNNYTVLDEPWRATTNNEEFEHCDSRNSWHGWYRLMYYGWNIRMPEKCVSHGCGTAGGVWMNDVHPRLKDGIVTRKMCISNWNPDCCSSAPSIRVKACPGNYYVYEFVRPNGCNFAYCADVDTISAPTPVPLPSSTALTNPCDELHCSDSEVCGEAYGVHGCLCKPNYYPIRDAYGFRAMCRKTTTLVYLTRCVLAEDGFPVEFLHLNDPNCRASVTHHTGSVLLKFNLKDCGTVLKVNKTHIIYENAVQAKVNFTDGHISRQRQLKMQFSCEYPRTHNVSMDMGIHTLTSNSNLTVPAVRGEYQVRMIPYQDADFTERFTGNVSVQSNERLYIAVDVTGIDSRNFSSVLDSCWATPIQDPTSSTRWDLITNQCPDPKDGTVVVVRNGVSTSSRFSFRMFTFDGSSSQVYLHCSLHLCHLGSINCIPICNPVHHQRARRSPVNQKKITISSGPLTFPANSADVLDVGAPQPKRRSPKL